MSMVNAFKGEDGGGLSPADGSLLARRERALGPAYRLFYARPLHTVRGDGAWLYDAEGRRYLDAYNNVASLGHGHPAVVEAIRRQAGVLNTHTRYLHEDVVAYAEALLAVFPEALRPGRAHLMLTCTGSEANDLAVRMAKAHTGARGLIVTRWAYHGVTEATAALSPSLGPADRRAARVWTVDAPGPKGAAAFAQGVEEALAEMAREGVAPAALIVDTLFSSDGVWPDPPGFLAPAVEAVRAAGGLFIADEVQAGFARVGSAFWGFARHGVVPDLVTLGKPMGNGHPVAGVVARADVVASFGRETRYFNTFGGNPVSVAAARAVLDTLFRDKLPDHAERLGARLRDAFDKLGRKAGGGAVVRGAGLFFGIELEEDGGAREGERATRIVNEMREAGVLISAIGPRGDVLKIRPPLTLTEEQADLLVEVLGRSLAKC